MRLKSSAGRISVHGNLEDDKYLYRELSAPAEIAAFSSTEGGLPPDRSLPVRGRALKQNVYLDTFPRVPIVLIPSAWVFAARQPAASRDTSGTFQLPGAYFDF